MELLITSYLLQCKECVLPGIGVLQIKGIPAYFDDVSNQLLPPSEEIILRKDSITESNGLIKYIADKKRIQQKEAEGLLTNFCNEWKENINQGGELYLQPLGSLYKKENGKISFRKETGFNFLPPLIINDPYKKSEEPELTRKEEPIIIEDPDLSHSEIIREEVITNKSFWVYRAAILFTIGVVLILLHLSKQKLSSSTIGNTNKLAIDSAGATYQLPK